MEFTYTINWKIFEKIWRRLSQLPLSFVVILLSIEASIFSIAYAHYYKIIVAYGDAESHLNIAKRVVTSLTPGIAQLGGIWLPLPHILMLPLIWFDPLWRSGLAGSIVSGISFVVSCFFLYKMTLMLTNNKLISFVAFIIFATNPNVLYMQSTPMTELPLIAFFILSTYYFIKFIKDTNNFVALTLASLFGFCATLSRYDGWFLVMFEAMIIAILHIRRKMNWNEVIGKVILFSTLAFFGILLWLLWDYLILGDIFYFTTSQFSAKSQQQGWLAKGQLPAYHNLPLSFLYYFLTSLSNTGVIIFAISLIGFVLYILNRHEKKRFYIALIMFIPFMFYVITLYIGQSLIFIPSLTPTTFEWTLFNARYGVMMIPTVAFFFAYAFGKAKLYARFVLIFLITFQFALYGIGYSRVISYTDGTEGLSQSKKEYVEYWMTQNYDGGLVLIDDYKRVISLIRMNIPMQNVIYIGNQIYWETSLQRPEKYARWIIMQKGDIIWTTFYDDKVKLNHVYKYYQKAYTSPNILIFKRMPQYDTGIGVQ